MPAKVSLKSRIPEIIAQTEVEIDLAMRNAAFAVEDRAKARCPVGEEYDQHPGRLRDSIHAEALPDGGYTVKADATDNNGYPYGVVVEFGGHHGQHGVGPHAFLYPALEEVRPMIATTFPTFLRAVKI